MVPGLGSGVEATIPTEVVGTEIEVGGYRVHHHSVQNANLTHLQFVRSLQEEEAHYLLENQ